MEVLNHRRPSMFRFVCLTIQRRYAPCSEHHVGCLPSTDGRYPALTGLRLTAMSSHWRWDQKTGIGLTFWKCASRIQWDTCDGIWTNTGEKTDKSIFASTSVFPTCDTSGLYFLARQRGWTPWLWHHYCIPAVLLRWRPPDAPIVWTHNERYAAAAKEATPSFTVGDQLNGPANGFLFPSFRSRKSQL